MTNTKPSWEEEINRMADHNQMILIDKTFLKVFIQKVEQEAYERGKEDFKKEHPQVK